MLWCGLLCFFCLDPLRFWDLCVYRFHRIWKNFQASLLAPNPIHFSSPPGSLLTCLILSYRSLMLCLFICLFSLVFFLCFILVHFHCYIFVFTDDFFCMSNVLRIPCHVFFLSAKCIFYLLKVPFGSFCIFHLTSRHFHGFLYILALPECIYHRCFNVLSANIIVSVILVSVSTD